MTAEQCACRQAEHENLIRELGDVIAELVMYVDMDNIPARVAERCAEILRKVRDA